VPSSPIKEGWDIKQSSIPVDAANRKEQCTEPWVDPGPNAVGRTALPDVCAHTSVEEALRGGGRNLVHAMPILALETMEEARRLWATPLRY